MTAAAVSSAVMRATDAFERATGKAALAHWNEFETWVEQQPEGDDLGAAVVAYQEVRSNG